MKRKKVIFSVIAGVLISGLFVNSFMGGRTLEESKLLNIDKEEEVISDDADKQLEQRKETQLEAGRLKGAESKRIQPGQEASEERNGIAVPERIRLKKPVVRLDGERGELSYRWDYEVISVDEDTLLVVCDCYFAEEMLQQKIFYLAEAPEFVLKEVFRQDSRVWEEEPAAGSPDFLEERMNRPKRVDNGYVYEADGMLYCLDESFRDNVLLADLHQLLGDLYLFSPGTYEICDVTPDASRLLACTDEGLYEYDLKHGEGKLLEKAYYAHREIVSVEDDCACGDRDFDFFGPVKAKYAPDGRSYAFLTGTEEADWGDYTGVVLRSADGETLYEKEADDARAFQWAEVERTIFLAFFYREDGETRMDKVDADTGEIMTFAVPDDILYGADICVSFLDADQLFYLKNRESGRREEDQGNESEFEIYRLDDGKRENPEAEGEVDWRNIVFNIGGYDTIPVRYPE